MPRPKSQAPAGASSIAVAAVAALLSSGAPAAAEAARAAAPAHATIVDPATLKGAPRVSPSRPGLAQAALQVTIRPEPIPGDPPASARRELVVVFD